METQVRELVRAIRDGGVVPAADLAERLSVSQRTVRNYVRLANQSLVGCARIRSRRGHGYLLDVSDGEALGERLSGPSQERVPSVPRTNDERVGYLLDDLLCRNGWITLDELSEILYVSRKTVSQNLREVEGTLDRFGLALEKRPRHGIRVVGSEIARRICLASSVMDGTGEGTESLGVASMLEAISGCVSSAIDEDGFQINSIAYQNLLVHIAVAVMRIRENCYVPMEPEHLERIRRTPEYATAQKVSRSIEGLFDIELPVEETAYIAIHLAGRQSLYLPASEADGSLVISDEIWDDVSRMLEVVYEAFRFDLRNDLELRMNLARHIVPLTVRLRYHMRLRNPLLSDIKARFPLAYSMAVDSSAVLADKYGSDLSEEEVGYIALAFALAIDRQKADPPKKNILVVCASGMGSARMLEHRYRQEFGPYVDRITACDVAHVSRMDFSDIDYVFTTVPIREQLPVPIREVTYFLDAQEIQSVKDVLRDDSSDAGIDRYFDEELFFPHLSLADKRGVIDFLCDRVAERRDVPSTFRELVWKREGAAQTSFGNQVSMPHPCTAVTAETFVCVGILDHPVDWNGRDVRAVFLVSVSDSRHKDLDRFYRAMSRLLTSRQDIQELVDRQEFTTLLSLLSKRSDHHDEE